MFVNANLALNGSTSPNLNLNVHNQLIFNLTTNVSIHPLLICQNSSIPHFCQGANGANALSTPITLAGASISITFTNAGIYKYGCKNHPGMGAMINVTSTSGTRNKLSGWFLLITLIATIFI
ncbi:unnamed protein product [Rotaria socialis]|uniref:Blue (type 1) copper domain-containing protein n=1 Tax=Rotaria socialis TaxID=392032 RepID=A0A821FXU2_9BILA|nr:unnamed protein product [Rotaria socialis]CAF3388781.1 unnamed protein product [Rotaria socialis]CAF3422769.1 unnamed protein product [Rotaria socialis]CAF3462267.1 unnamed protein product [Rotaria socialis]CAF3690649.1 unnamed protein product [Rotaria socialis]